MGMIKTGAKVVAATALIYFSSTYIANSYFRNKKQGKEFPAAATIEQIAEDAGNLVKGTGKYTAKAIEYGIKNGKEITDNIVGYNLEKQIVIPNQKE